VAGIGAEDQAPSVWLHAVNWGHLAVSTPSHPRRLDVLAVLRACIVVRFTRLRFVLVSYYAASGLFDFGIQRQRPMPRKYSATSGMPIIIMLIGSAGVRIIEITAITSTAIRHFSK